MDFTKYKNDLNEFITKQKELLDHFSKTYSHLLFIDIDDSVRELGNLEQNLLGAAKITKTGDITVPMFRKGSIRELGNIPLDELQKKEYADCTEAYSWRGHRLVCLNTGGLHEKRSRWDEFYPLFMTAPYIDKSGNLCPVDEEFKHDFQYTMSKFGGCQDFQFINLAKLKNRRDINNQSLDRFYEYHKKMFKFMETIESFHCDCEFLEAKTQEMHSINIGINQGRWSIGYDEVIGICKDPIEYKEKVQHDGFERTNTLAPGVDSSMGNLLTLFHDPVMVALFDKLEAKKKAIIDNSLELKVEMEKELEGYRLLNKLR